MPSFDVASVTAIGVASAALISAALLRRRVTVQLVFIVVAALTIRIDPARQTSLHAWDERVHAVVAKHFISHPWTPVLYENPAFEPDPADWNQAHVWLHKPPLAMWGMAASMAMFGVNSMSMRLPSILLSTLSVVLTFLIGRRLFDDRTALLAASFQAVNGLLVGLASGRRVADHVDTALITYTELGIFFVIVGSRRWPRLAVLLAGAALAAALLTKSAPALLIAVVAFAMWFDSRSIARFLRKFLLFAITAAVIAVPWFASSYIRFPEQARAASNFTIMHVTTAVEGHGGPWFAYLQDMPHFLGELIFLPIVWFCFVEARRFSDRAQWALLTWFLTPYIVFSAMATKLPGFVSIAVPAVCLIEAAFWMRLRQAMPTTSSPTRWAIGGLLAILAILPARYLLERTGPFEARDRSPASTKQLMSLDRDLGLSDAVIFNMPKALEAMFYSRYTAYSRMPTPQEVQHLQRLARPIIIFRPLGSQVDIPAGWGARILDEIGQ